MSDTKKNQQIDPEAEALLQKMEGMLDDSASVPFSNKKMVDPEELHEYIDKIRLCYMPDIQRAKDVTKEKNNILAEAKRQADEIIKEAKAEADRLVMEQEIIRRAAEYAKTQAEKADAAAADIIAQAQAKDKAIREAMVANVNQALEEASAVLSKNLDAVNSTKDAIAKISQPAE